MAKSIEYGNGMRKLPTVDTWSQMRFLEIEKPEDFSSIGYNPYGIKPRITLLMQRPPDDPRDIQGVICPIPKELMPDPQALSEYYNAIRGHKEFRTIRQELSNDITHRIQFDDGLENPSNRHLPEGLVTLEGMLRKAFKATLDEDSKVGIYQIDSNNHQAPGRHEPAGILSLEGDTTIMFQINSRKQLIGKKSLPPNSMTIFIGYHAAPDPWEPRLNIICA